MNRTSYFRKYYWPRFDTHITLTWDGKGKLPLTEKEKEFLKDGMQLVREGYKPYKPE